MYTPGFNQMAADDVLPMLRSVRFGHLVTSVDGLASTPLPFLVDDDVSIVRAHFARANDHWRSIDGADALLVVPGHDGYISPQWYPSKLEHAKVVPTWNYGVIHIHGRIEVRDDAEWKLSVVSDLTDENEPDVSGGTPWEVNDAPDDFISKQLRAIVGVQLNVGRVEAKQKWSQNRNDADRIGAANGLSEVDRVGAEELAHQMRNQ